MAVYHQVSACVVSIRSRLFEAGEPAQRMRQFYGQRFQSAPASLRRENLYVIAEALHKVKFQSAPASLRRENPGRATKRVPLRRFNPLPPL